MVKLYEFYSKDSKNKIGVKCHKHHKFQISNKKQNKIKDKKEKKNVITRHERGIAFWVVLPGGSEAV